MTQQTSTPTVERVEEVFRDAYRQYDDQRAHTTTEESDEGFDYGMHIIRTAVVEDIAGFLDTVYQGKAADLIRAKARAGKFVNGTP